MIFFTDLDRTIIYSAKLVEDKSKYSLVESIGDREVSYMTKESLNLIRKIQNSINVVPVSTRSYSQIMRLSFISETQPKYIICDNGLSIYINGERDLEWDRQIENNLTKYKCDINAIFLLAKSIDKSLYSKIDIMCDKYIRIKFNRVTKTTKSLVSKVIRDAVHENYTVHSNSTKVYILPSFATKELAVKYIKDKNPCNKSICAGDSDMDLGMLLEADISIAPRHRTFNSPNMIITKEKGIEAGEEILRLVQDYIS